MLRVTTTHNLRRVSNLLPSQGRYITSAQKRALEKDHISPPTSEKTAKPPTKTVSPPPSPSSTSSGSSFLPTVVGLSAVGVGVAYAMGVIPSDVLSVVPGFKKDENEKKEETNAEVEKQQEMQSLSKQVEKPSTKEVTGNRVLNIHAPSAHGRKSEPVPIQTHSDDGNRVTVKNFLQVYGGGDDSKSVDKVEPHATSVEYETSDVMKSQEPAKDITTAMIVEAQKELRSSSLQSNTIDLELAKAHALDEKFMKELEGLTIDDLKMRIIQLASEMNDRTRWEAVRLREFLGMKEKEISEKFMDKMQKQRLEFEDLLARRLREQEHAITKSANEALDAKEKSMEAVVNAAVSAQQAEYEAAMQASTENLQTELRAKYEAEFGAKLAEEKSSMIADMEKKVAAIKALSERLQQAEQNLQISRNFETGSQRAHRVSAAALALAEKMESSHPAFEEFVALKAAAAESSVVASALDRIPSSVKSGIPTISELQASFDRYYQVGREASYVPVGRSGIGAQFAGKVFAMLSGPPSPDTAPPEDDSGKMSDYILARAKRYVHAGNLEKAIEELDQLKGQTAFTVEDWKLSAMDRISVEKALKVIKMECALLNKNMGG
mmetsp:Transcript_8255/g.15551  ORF Transcript_8255/g.15551 Transcript_8255/m.15551 type:complete len:608 (-) Transcript_8255:1923-3746(-)|eukprot:CAMPEP_0176480360 /NCGR_PEP_ID=MMETSP0200_2-20121128/2235_1 /TAXON_ID=947934 /ORGANISM="Chaetoceros sp., Strain GSL56" /LENGTH=607 /DNA_ID=CAMNT_0017876473 /DNA_START=228 /DNA_END=2051 /DNA_ORIENTATION=+